MSVRFSNRALSELMVLVQSQPKKATKALRLLELIERDFHHPQIGKVEKLRHLEGYSLRLDHENRIIFSMREEGIYVYSIIGHYE